MRDFDELVKRYHIALQDFVKGNAKPMEDLFSHREDVSLANPFGGIVDGWESGKEALERAASFYEEGMHSFENVMKYEASELAHLIEIEKFKTKLGG